MVLTLNGSQTVWYSTDRWYLLTQKYDVLGHREQVCFTDVMPGLPTKEYQLFEALKSVDLKTQSALTLVLS
jgi:hypothetical protein